MADDTHADTDPIDAREAREQIVFIRDALAATDPDEQRQIVANALLRFGIRFCTGLNYGASIAPDETRAELEQLNDLAGDLFPRWLLGEDLTDREDEPERRAAAALEALQIGGSGIARLAAEALLKLPEGHPKRDLAAIRSMLEERLESNRREGEWEDALSTAASLIFSNTMSEPETATLIADLRRAEADARAAGADIDKAGRARFFRAASLDYFRRSVVAREDGADATPFIATAQALLEEARAIEPSPKDDLTLALTLQEAEQWEPAADLLAPIVDNRSEMYEQAAWIEGMIRLRLGHFSRAIEVLAPLMPAEERDYLLALDDADVEDAGERFSKDAVNLAFAYAFADRWSEALATIDRVKSPRLRHAQRLRQTPEGKELLRLEAALASARRGVPVVDSDAADREEDPLGARISRQARLLEQYRSKRPDLAASSLVPPTLAELGETLAAEEALVCLGSGFRGVLAGIVLRGDRDAPSGRMLFEELTQDVVVA